MTAAGLVPIEVAAAAASWLANRKLRVLTLWCLSLGSRQRRADKRAMYWAFILQRCGHGRLCRQICRCRMLAQGAGAGIDGFVDY
jgi:hypothetical protein